jgi:hypothetical protein
VRSGSRIVTAGATAMLVGFLIGVSTSAAWATFSGSAVASASVSTATLAAPTGLAATGLAGVVNLSWTATTSGFASGTRVFRATTTGGPYTQVAQIVGASITTYIDNPGVGTFYYVVRAYYSGNAANWTSTNSNEASATA